MPTHRSSVAELAKWLHSIPQPVYVLDEELTVVFINRACRDWLGAASEGLVGIPCKYHSGPTVVPADLVAAGLCPPPTVLGGEICAAAVSSPEDGTPGDWHARFVPLAADGDVFGIVAIVESADRPSDVPDDQAPADRTDRDLDPQDVDPAALHDRIRRFRRDAAARVRLDRLIGSGPAMILARSQAELAAGCRSSVLLIGPAGSGRQHLAAAIHYGPRSSQPLAASQAAGLGSGVRPPGLVPVDCALLGTDLVEAVLESVGRATQRGQLGMPGTLLMHRVDEVPSDVQVQLADFLRRRLARWRLIATAAAPLGELARRGAFHAELAALLSTIVIELPPLRDRRDDLPLLAQLFLEERNAAGSKQVGGFSQAALERLDAYPWPGNLDELAEVVADAHQRAAGREIRDVDLPERLHVAAQAAAHPRRVDETIVLTEYLSRVERELIRRALARAKGNKAKAARLLGVTRPRLYRRMVQLRLEQ